MSEPLPMPPVTHRADGGERRVGVELEFSGLTLDEAAALVAAAVGGAVSAPGRYERSIDGDPAGAWQVEVDFGLLKELGRRERHRPELADAAGDLAEDVLRLLAAHVVPMEVVSPPLPLGRLAMMNDLIAELRAAGARGTGEEWAYAFGLQLNPEMPDTDADTVRHYLQAFLCLEDWLRERADVDLTRRLTAFAEPFSKAYARRVIAADYAPGLDGLIDDYLEANPTRNRALDLLPLLLYLDPARVRAVVDDPRVKPRPTLHYRLPNSEIEHPDWDLGVAWGDWLVVERLAASPARLQALCAAYAHFLSQPLERLVGDWSQTADAWLREHRLR
ncbi:amidoligase family protein [uncultured Thiohalocapsa sp.]|uniref:amidoligase family protein n=1 Tax=uncultured Thiohalocapsa sp. TaxID=768990 RepID=UPI0025F2726E|nr:amidoligase family protein [uncultured Thiohalocapsa sp.]